MRLLAGIVVFLSFFATHAAGSAFAPTGSSEPVPAQYANVMEKTLISGDRLACCPEPETVSQADPNPCQQTDCLFILPVADRTVVRVALATGSWRRGGARPGRTSIIDPPPIF